jgi:hypothetical protein
MSVCKGEESWNCNSKNPCFHTISGWEHMWLYWVLRKWGLPREIVSIILGSHKKNYWSLDIYSKGYQKNTDPDTTKMFQKAMNFKYFKNIRENNILLSSVQHQPMIPNVNNFILNRCYLSWQWSSYTAVDHSYHCTYENNESQ